MSLRHDRQAGLATTLSKSAAKGVKIVFSEGGAPKKTLCYFSTDLTKGGVKNSGFLAFCDSSALPTQRQGSPCR